MLKNDHFVLTRGTRKLNASKLKNAQVRGLSRDQVTLHHSDLVETGNTVPLADGKPRNKAPQFSKTEIDERIKSIETEMIFDAHYKWNIVKLADEHSDVIKYFIPKQLRLVFKVKLKL